MCLPLAVRLDQKTHEVVVTPKNDVNSNVVLKFTDFAERPHGLLKVTQADGSNKEVVLNRVALREVAQAANDLADELEIIEAEARDRAND